MDIEAIGKRFAEHSAVVEAALNKAKQADAEISGRLGELEQRVVRGVMSGRSSEAETWGDAIARSDAFRSLAVTQSGKVRIPLETKTTLTQTTGSGAALAPSDRKPGPNLLPRRRLRFRDALSAGRTDSSVIEYPRQTTRTTRRLY